MTFSAIRPEKTGEQLPGRQLADSANLLGCHQFQFAERIQPVADFQLAYSLADGVTRVCQGKS